MKRHDDEVLANGVTVIWSVRPAPLHVLVRYGCCGHTAALWQSSIVKLRRSPWGRCAQCQRGPAKGCWKGEDASLGAKRMRAQRLFKDLGMCEHCGRSAATDRHHKDGNPGNNVRENIAFLCGRCHVTVDGRLEAMMRRRAELAAQIQPPKPCVQCGRPYKPLRRGLCNACRQRKLSPQAGRAP